MSKTSTQQRIECSKSAAPLLRKKYEEKYKVYYTTEGKQWVGNPPRPKILHTGNQPILKNN